MKNLFKRNFKKLMSIILACCIILPSISVVYAVREDMIDEGRLINRLRASVPLSVDMCEPKKIPYVVEQCAMRNIVNFGTLDKRNCVEMCVEKFSDLIKILSEDRSYLIDYDEYNRILLSVEIVCVVYAAHYDELAEQMLSILKCFENHSIMLQRLFMGTNEWFVRKLMCKFCIGVSAVREITSLSGT